MRSAPRGGGFTFSAAQGLHDDRRVGKGQVRIPDERERSFCRNGVAMECPTCNRDNPRHARYCDHCGTVVGKTCEACGTVLSKLDSYCDNCGTDQAQQPAGQQARVGIPSGAEEIRSALVLATPLLLLIGIFLVRALFFGDDADSSQLAPTHEPAVVLGGTYKVVNTGPGNCANGSAGVSLREAPASEQRTPGYCDGALLVMIGPDVERDGQLWREIRGADGREGYVPAQFTEWVD